MNIIRRNNVQCLRAKAADAPTLIYGHGFGCSQEMWSKVTPAFTQHEHQVLFDYVGSGRSDASAFQPARYAQLDGYVEDLLEVCDALELSGDLTFVGHSISCSIGILAAIRRPRLFSRLILLGPSPCFLNEQPDYHGGFERSDLEGLLDLMAHNYLGWAQQFAPLVAADEDAAVTTQLSDSFCSTDPVMARLFAQATFFSDIRPALQHCPVPSLILHHQRDALVPTAVADYLHAALADSTLQTLDVSGHCAHMSHPELVSAAMHRYLKGARARVLP
ncbi:alpha/beta fold hydrolase [Ectopseudomonas guguanensis]|jgi:sigma-B regulation protein RsbQ|uniref:alpha/beta fold hydrolase n=1 Tax=Ectopseudomonas guguanensis TaxID=1198456 RepID=UPI0012D6570F|nr:alpha/beta hydrolase [Pseudomonas sp.]MPT19886.1 alpha/beta hydrolase [Pseudomonas sp.]